MYNTHGNTIAYQYAGSFLVNTLNSYRKEKPWTSHSRDTIESIKRFYSNSFTDAEKQDAMNVFLGKGLGEEGGDQYLHDTPTIEHEPFYLFILVFIGRYDRGYVIENVNYAGLGIHQPDSWDRISSAKKYVSMASLIQETVYVFLLLK